MAVFVPNGQFNPASLQADDLYIQIQQPPGYITGVPTDVFGVVGTASWGQVNQPAHMGSPFDALQNFGPVGAAALTDPYDLATDLAIAFGQAASQASLEGWGVRVSDGTDTKATATLAGTASSAAELATLTGTITNGDSGTITFTSSAVTGSPLAITIPVVTADTLTTIAAKFVLAINSNAALVAVGVWASSLAGVISIYQPASLSPQITFTKTSGSSLTITLSAGTAATSAVVLSAVCTGILGNSIACTLQAGSAANTWTALLSLPNLSLFEMYPNISTTGGFWINFANAINKGMSNIRGPSAICTAGSVNLAVGAPTAQTVTASGGTDGRSGVTSAILIGSDSSLPKTGLYALRQLNPGVGVAWLCGCTDITAPPTLLPFGLSEGVTMLFPFAAGTSTAAALASVSSIGVHDSSFAYVKDWVYWFDVLNNQVRLVPPTAFIGGRIATLSPCVNPGNEPVNLVEGTERNNPFQSAHQPYTVSEVGQLENAGIMFITNPIPAGSEWGIRHGQTTSLSPSTGGVEWWRMNVFLARSFAGVMGQFVDQNQSQQPSDPLRRAVKNQLNSFLTFLKSPGAGAGDGNGLIDDFTVICTFNPNSGASAGNGVNTPQSIAQHYLFVLVRVTFLSNVRFFILALQGGTTVVTVGATQGQQLS